MRPPWPYRRPSSRQAGRRIPPACPKRCAGVALTGTYDRNTRYEAQPPLAPQGDPKPQRRLGAAQPAEYVPDPVGVSGRAVPRLPFAIDGREAPSIAGPPQAVAPGPHRGCGKRGRRDVVCPPLIGGPAAHARQLLLPGWLRVQRPLEEGHRRRWSRGGTGQVGESLTEGCDLLWRLCGAALHLPAPLIMFHCSGRAKGSHRVAQPLH